MSAFLGDGAFHPEHQKGESYPEHSEIRKQSK